MISLSQQSCAKVTRSFSPLSQRNSKPSEHQRRLLSATATRPLMGPLTARISGFTFKKQIMRSHNAIHPLCINHRQAVPLRLPSAALTHGDNHTSAGQPPPCLSGTIRWYRQNGAAVCDPVSQMAGERPNAQLRTHTPRLLQTSLIRRSQATRAHAQSIFCPAELHGLFEYLGFHRLFAQKALEFANLLIGGSEVRRPAPLPRPMQQPSVNRLNIACAI